jgi:hypothetical protein
MSEEVFIVRLPISEAQADVAGAPVSWIERIVRSIGTPQAQPWPYPPMGFGTLVTEYCECETPMIRCDTGGCRCQKCGKQERVWMQNNSTAMPDTQANSGTSPPSIPTEKDTR